MKIGTKNWHNFTEGNGGNGGNEGTSRLWSREICTEGNKDNKGNEKAKAFTMIEIAISLAVIGFALVAIIGILPSAMQVQKENREETIVDQDASVFIDLIRNGAKGMDDLTNYVVAITNTVTDYFAAGKPSPSYTLGFTYTVSTKNGVLTTPQFPITNGYRIVGLLSTPKYASLTAGKNVGFSSNYVVAYVRSMSGPASEKYPQSNPSMQQLTFSYRMISDVVPYASYYPGWTNYTDPTISGNTNEILLRSNYWRYQTNFQNTLYDVRLAFRWPLFANGTSGNGRLDFRTMVSGSLTNDVTFPAFPIYFFQNRNYVKSL